MPHDPIARLLAEHVQLMAQLAPFRATLAELAASSAEPGPAQLATLREGAGILTTDLIAHARREDDVFFPAVEAAVGGEFGPTRVMRREHSDIHDGADLFHDTLRELHEVQHPAIVAGGAEISSLVEGGGDIGRLLTLGTRLLDLIDDHFSKEERILFPMSRTLLDAGQLAAVGRQLEEFDAR